MKFVRKFGNYYSENRQYMIERDKFWGWNLYKKSSDKSVVFDIHIINCTTIKQCKNYVA